LVGDLPIVERRARRPFPFRLARGFAVFLVVLLLGLPLIVHLMLPREEVAGLASGGSPLHVLITGSDSRAGLSAQERVELTTGGAGGERADTILLLTIDGGRAGLLAFPRDLSVTRCDGSVGRINGALAIGGSGCLVQTVRQLSGIPVHHHVAVTFGGFRDVVDAVGGVELCLDRPLKDRSAGIDLPAGCQVLDGRDALGFVRVRKIDSDFARIERQQRFLRALAGELVSPALLVQPWRLVPAVIGVTRAVTVDERMNPVDLARIAVGLRALASGSAVTATVPADGFRGSGGAALLRIREAEAAVLFAGFADGSLLRAVTLHDADSSAVAVPAGAVHEGSWRVG
jgi:LCP family protein required for cell wall assembly